MQCASAGLYSSRPRIMRVEMLYTVPVSALSWISEVTDSTAFPALACVLLDIP
jgi:hypothetical protein